MNLRLRSRPRWLAFVVVAPVLCLVLGLSAMAVAPSPASGQTTQSLAISPTAGLAGSSFTLTPSGFPAGVGCLLKYTWNPRAPITLGANQSPTAAFHTRAPTSATNGTYPITASCTEVTGLTLSAATRFTVTGPATTTTTSTTTTTTRPTTTTTRPTTTTTRPTTTTGGATTTTAKGATTTTAKGGATSTTGKGTTGTTTASSASTTSVSIDTTPTTVPGQAPVTASTYLRLTALAIAPGAAVSANGRGCDAGPPVTLTIGSAAVGHTRASSSGAFHAPLSLGPLSVGRYTVVARCGVILAAPLDIVLASQVSAATSTLAVIIFVLLIGALAFRRQIFPRRPAPPAVHTGPEASAEA